MNLIDILILSAIEGLTEFLPVSSTGHLIIVSKILTLPADAFSVSFLITIQLGAVLAIAYLYWPVLFFNRPIIYRLILAFLPTALLGFLFYAFVKNFLLTSPTVVAWAFLLGGVIIVVFELFHRRRIKEVGLKEIEALSYGQTLMIGFSQAVALIPGVSRSAASIIGGLMTGLSHRAAVEFSFLLAVPTLAAATGFDLLKNITALDGVEIGDLLTGFLLSFIFALLAIKLLLFYVSRFSFIPFGIYRIILGTLLILLII